LIVLTTVLTLQMVVLLQCVMVLLGQLHLTSTAKSLAFGVGDVCHVLLAMILGLSASRVLIEALFGAQSTSILAIIGQTTLQRLAIAEQSVVLANRFRVSVMAKGKLHMLFMFFLLLLLLIFLFSFRFLLSFGHLRSHIWCRGGTGHSFLWLNSQYRIGR